MGALASKLIELIRAEQYLVGVHAASQMRVRRITAWQAASGTLDGKLLRERSNDRPNPAAEFLIGLPDGTEAKAVWSHLRSENMAKLVTVHYLDR
jgi:hypothetical protein